MDKVKVLFLILLGCFGCASPKPQTFVSPEPPSRPCFVQPELPSIEEDPIHKAMYQ
jgi:hypothetical protein